MIETETRQCQCGCTITYVETKDNHTASVIQQFIAIMKKGALVGLPALTENCPTCHTPLTLQTTRPISVRK